MFFLYFCWLIINHLSCSITMKSIIWEKIENLNKEYNSLNLGEVVDYNKFYLYSIITHSTAIEGSTLTEKDTQLLFDDGITDRKSVV